MIGDQFGKKQSVTLETVMAYVLRECHLSSCSHMSQTNFRFPFDFKT